ncbi:hypothetical protein TUM19329_19960 [Legionella antarctica]|uniref:YetF C-terminal domain-containing protein n=1 Tax=Legionella antarctica TaxID=2708020 RepID=A0A6F8T4M1_9GAMM|nr:YetF domain-containing protein [Legionella antarctica]BCA95635.1 hypothetical protein TUM19329_19960 [Legionella antarctica]
MAQFFGWNDLFNYDLYIRAIIITLYAIFLFRTNSTRLYGNHSPLDFIIYIILGAILGEAIVKSVPTLPSMVVCTLIVAIHRLLSYMGYKSHWIGKYIKGEKICLIKNGKYIEKSMSSCRITPNDIKQALRFQHGSEDISSVKKGTLERSGEISFILNE